MHIHRILTLAFLLLLLLATAPLVALSFYASKVALETEIGRSLNNDAALLMEQIDMLVFERLQNVHSWSHLDIMQEGRIGDVDKRLAQFLAELQNGYPGAYSRLFYVDNSQHIVAASTPSLIHQTFQPPPDWLSASVPHGEVFLSQLQLVAPYQNAELLIRAPLPDPYTTGDVGQLWAALDLTQVFSLFDHASHSESGARFVLLLDAQGRPLAASAAVRGQQLLLGNTFADWPTQGQQLAVHAGQPLTDSSVLVGVAHSKGYQGYANMGWTLLVLQSTQQAFQPIWALWWLFCSVFVVTGLIASVVAQRVAKRIAQPLLDLTAWVQRFQNTGDNAIPKVAGAYEVRALSLAFGNLTEALAHSRLQVEQAAKLAVVGEMAAIMAHEVRTPLGILQTTAQMLQWETQLSPEGLEMTAMIVEESARLNRLIATLLDCARPRPPLMCPHDVHQIISRVLDLLASQAQKKALSISWVRPSSPATLECDEELLVQVFLNLILNAIQLLPNGGQVQILTNTRNPQFLSVYVDDDGPGILPEQRTRLFDPFFTTREGGIGLGLTVTQQIVRVHGGQLSADTSPLGGARFTLHLPWTQEHLLC